MVPGLLGELAQSADELRLREADGDLLLERLGLHVEDEHDLELRPRWIAEPALERLQHRLRAEVLRLDVDQALGALDRSLIQIADLRARARRPARRADRSG